MLLMSWLLLLVDIDTMGNTGTNQMEENLINHDSYLGIIGYWVSG